MALTARDPLEVVANRVARKMMRIDRAVFVVTESTRDQKPLHLSFRLADAKAFVLTYNRINQTGRTVIRPGRAAIFWYQVGTSGDASGFATPDAARIADNDDEILRRAGCNTRN